VVCGRPRALYRVPPASKANSVLSALLRPTSIIPVLMSEQVVSITLKLSKVQDTQLDFISCIQHINDTFRFIQEI